MTDITELVKRLRERSGQYDEYGWHSEIELEAADALEAQAKEIKIYQQTELTYVTRVADAQREYSEMQAKLKARIAELEAALKPFATLPTHGEYGGPLVQARVYYECEPNDRCGIVHINKTAFRAARAALKGEKR